MEDHIAFIRVLSLVILLISLIVLLNVLGGYIPVLGHLPGDIEFDYPGGSMYLPMVTSALVSAVLTSAAYVLSTFWKK